MFGDGFRYLWQCITAPFRWIAALFRWLERTLVSIARWALHPTGKAILISIFAIAVGVTITALAIGMYFPWPEMKTIGGGMTRMPGELVPVEFSDIVARTGITVLFLTMFGALGTILAGNTKGHKIRRVVFVISKESTVGQSKLGAKLLYGDEDTASFYSRWERYSTHSPVMYFVLELIRFFKSILVCVLFTVFIIVYWVTLGGALTALVTVPVTIFALFMVSLYRIAQRSAHWQCFGVTLVTTVASALIFHNSFSNEVLLWMVALGTGVASGVLTEGLRQLGIWWGETEIGFHYLSISYDDNQLIPFSIARPVWKKLSMSFDNIISRVGSFACR